MSAYLDSMGHLIADSEDELHAFAASIGLRRSWYQGPPEHEFWHYDCIGSKRRAAVEAGAVYFKDPRDLVERHPFHAEAQRRIFAPKDPTDA